MEFEIEELIRRHCTGDILSKWEAKKLQEWCNIPNNKLIYNQIAKQHRAIYASTKAKEVNVQHSFLKVTKKIQRNTFLRNTRYAAAVACIGIFTFSIYLLKTPQHQEIATTVVHKEEALLSQPRLTTSSGLQVNLTDSLHKEIIEEGVAITVTDKNTLTYNVTQPQDSVIYNILEIPRGCMYQLTLSDGTKVSLNADSKLTFPPVFGKNERRVILQGEGYFEVAQETNRPFIVDVKDYNIKVLGTSFNVRNYPNYDNTTTLKTGKIAILHGSSSCELKPGEQATYNNNTVNVSKADLSTTMAWVNDLFQYKNKKLEYVLDDISRWYDVTIFYQNNSLKELRYTATFRRSSTLKEIVTILSETQQFNVSLQNKTLIITP
ncbi:MAG: FecR family protein [Marinifilaceae bacterium]